MNSFLKFYFILQRRCLHPQLPVCAVCSECKLDGWYKEPKVQGKESDRPEQSPELYECVVCLDIVHPKCAKAMGRINNGKTRSIQSKIDG